MTLDEVSCNLPSGDVERFKQPWDDDSIDSWVVIQNYLSRLKNLPGYIPKLTTVLEIHKMTIYDKEHNLVAVYRETLDGELLGMYLDRLRGGTFVSLRDETERKNGAEGNLQQQVEPKTRHDILGNALNGMVTRLNALLYEMDRLTQAVQEGKLETRGEADEFEGGWQDLVLGVNNVIDAFMTPINVTSEYLGRISRFSSTFQVLTCLLKEKT